MLQDELQQVHNSPGSDFELHVRHPRCAAAYLDLSSDPESDLRALLQLAGVPAGSNLAHACWGRVSKAGYLTANAVEFMLYNHALELQNVDGNPQRSFLNPWVIRPNPPVVINSGSSRVMMYQPHQRDRLMPPTDAHDERNALWPAGCTSIFQIDCSIHVVNLGAHYVAVRMQPRAGRIELYDGLLDGAFSAVLSLHICSTDC